MTITVNSLEKKISNKAKGSDGQFLPFWNVVGYDSNGAPIKYTCWSPAITSKLNCTMELGVDYTTEDKGNNYIKMNLTDKGKGKTSTTNSSAPDSGGGKDYVQIDSERLKTMFTSYAKDLVIAVYNNVAPKANNRQDLEDTLYSHLLFCQKAIVDTADLMLLAITGKPKDEALGVPSEDTDLEPF